MLPTLMRKFFLSSHFKNIPRIDTKFNNSITANVDDNVYPDEAVGYDDDVTDGLFAWTTVGVDLSKDSDISEAAHLYAEGGIAVASTFTGGTAPSK